MITFIEARQNPLGGTVVAVVCLSFVHYTGRKDWTEVIDISIPRGEREGGGGNLICAHCLD